MVWTDLKERISRLKRYLKSDPSYARHYYSAEQNMARDAILENFTEIFEHNYIPPLPITNLIAMINNILAHPKDNLSQLSAENIAILYQFSKAPDQLRQNIFNHIMQFYCYASEDTEKAMTIEKQLLPLRYYHDALDAQNPIKDNLKPLIRHFRKMLQQCKTKEIPRIMHEVSKTAELLDNTITTQQYHLNKKNKPTRSKKILWNKHFFENMKTLETLMLALKQTMGTHPINITIPSDSATDTTEAMTEISFDDDFFGSFDDDLEEDDSEEDELAEENRLEKENTFTQTKEANLVEASQNISITPPDETIPPTNIMRLRHKISALKQQGVKNPQMMGEEQRFAHKNVLKILEILLNDDSLTDNEAFMVILENTARIIEEVASAHMGAGFWYSMAREPHEVIPKDGQFILQLRHYPKLQAHNLAQEMMRLCGLMAFRIESLMNEPLKTIPTHEAHQPTPPMRTSKPLQALKQYLDERNHDTGIEARARPLLSVFSKILASGTQEEQKKANEAIENTTALLNHNQISYQAYVSLAEKMQAAASADLQIMGSLMIELNEETLKERPFQAHIGRINTSRTQKSLAPLDKYMLKNPNISPQLEPLCQVFSNMLESSSQKDRIKAKEEIENTINFLHGHLSIEAYQQSAEHAKGAPSPLWQLMGKLMIALSAALLVAGLVTGVAPASIAGGAGLVTGLSMFSKASERTGQSKHMLDLVEVKDKMKSSSDNNESTKHTHTPSKK